MRGFIIFITLVLFFSLCTGLIICWIANFTSKGKVGLSMRKREYVVLGNRARLVIKYGKPRSKFWRFMQDIGKGNGIYEAELTLPKTMDFNDRTILQNLFLG